MSMTVDQEQSDILGSLGRDALKVLLPLGILIFVPVLLLLAAFGGLPEAVHQSGAAAAVQEIPPDQLEVMQQTSLRTGIPWQVFAALAWVESGFGANMGPSTAGAVGYCQFLPSTWDAYGVDGNGDGVTDPYDYRDCIPAAARYLQATGAPADLRSALYAYNHSWAYVDKVLAYAAGYGYAHASSIPARAVDLVRSKVGAPYVWGASGPDSFDCSGLIVWVYSQLGVIPPRTAQQQYDWASPVDAAGIQPGDLLFYENTYASSERITHVTIYVGGGNMITAPSAGDFVKVVPISDPYWQEHFVSAGRPRYWEAEV